MRRPNSKTINEAYERIKSGEPDHAPHGFGGGGSWGGFNINDIMSNIAGFGGGFNRPRKHFNKTEITVPQTISFRESVVGCTREIVFNRDEKCQACDGQGGKQIDNGCKKCKGKGMVVSQHGNIFTQMPCPDCHGKTKEQSCGTCAGKGFSTAEARLTINIPPGITPERNVVGIAGQGHYVGNGMMGDAHTQVLLVMTITPLEDLKLVDEDVVSSLKISLLEALEGCVKSVMTIDGAKETTVKSGIRNKDEIVMPNLGLSGVGNHRVIVDVEYPSDVEKLVAALKDEVKDDVVEETNY